MHHIARKASVLAWAMPWFAAAIILATARDGSVEVADDNGELVSFLPANDNQMIRQNDGMWLAVTMAIYVLGAAAVVWHVMVAEHVSKSRMVVWWLNWALAAAVAVLAAYPFMAGQPGLAYTVVHGFIQKKMIMLPLLEWAYCGQKLSWQYANINRGKPMYLFNTWSNADPKDYDGGYVVIPPPSLRRFASNGDLVEVVHQSEQRNRVAWHYVLPGTGVYARFSNIRTHPTHRDFVLSMELRCADYQCYGSIDAAFERARDEGYDAVQFTHHADQMCGNVLTELVALGSNGYSVCPIDYYDSEGFACSCNSSLTFSNCGSPLNSAPRPGYPLRKGVAMGILVMPLLAFVIALKFYARHKQAEPARLPPYTELPAPAYEE